MIYLVILVLAASVSIGRLWMMQRRQRSHLQTVDGFRSSLQRLSEPATLAPVRARPAGGRQAAVRKNPAPRRIATPRMAHRRPEKLDPARRAAAKRRIEARRAARQPF
ncbi:MAG: hypothetical protein ACRDJB_00490 [Actinomycetota bacterium]